ncbi:MAG: FAD-binding protein [Gemmatimonas sp.]|nr:FAD-binding protein [Gemmatimonas sp.]
MDDTRVSEVVKTLPGGDGSGRGGDRASDPFDVGVGSIPCAKASVVRPLSYPEATWLHSSGRPREVLVLPWSGESDSRGGKHVLNSLKRRAIQGGLRVHLPRVHFMASSIQQLYRQVTGDVLSSKDADYDQIRRGWDLTIDHYPKVILVPHDAADIAAGVRFAHESGLAVAVQSTGHGMLYPADDNLLIVTSRMTSIQVDAEARTALVEAGTTWQQVLDTATPHSLAPLLGSSPHVGVVGYMLGGGIGWLARRYGFGSDSLRQIDIVTADGVLRHASPSENSELFWGLRGGGGNFGVVVAMEFDLYPVPALYGGSLVYPEQTAGEALRFYRDWIRTVPDELTSSIAIVSFPSLPQVPEAFRGKTLVLVVAAFAGPAVEGEPWMRPWLDWQAPIDNSLREMPFSEIGTITNDPVDPVAEYGSSDMFDDLSDDAIDAIVRLATDSASPLTLNVLRHAGGAIAGAPADASAIGNRDASLYLLIGGAVPDSAALATVKAYIQRYRAALQPYVRGGVWMNFMNGNGDGARERVTEAYLPEAQGRLAALKAKYDPDNMFRFSYQLTGLGTQEGSTVGEGRVKPSA